MKGVGANGGKWEVGDNVKEWDECREMRRITRGRKKGSG